MITFFLDESLAERGAIRLDEAAAQHARARRVQTGDAARVLNGRGQIAAGLITSIDRKLVDVEVRSLHSIPQPTPLDVIVPVADRDRLLTAAEKCAELQVTSWRPAMFTRSHSVNPRGEGPKFRDKVLARMRAALEQSGGAWLPEVHAESSVEEALRAVPATSARFVLHADGSALPVSKVNGPVAFVVGPEGGYEPSELELAASLQWTPVALGATTLRFETAIIAGAAVVRTLQTEVPLHGG